ncbi:MAG: inositol-3-phosphate synthase, partial [Nitrospinaceae bacterium]|nr:inositol-3-phosphate synthase [Nitrospinaceae bacterium]
SVEDSPNSAGVVIDSIRCTKLALNRGQGGVLYAPSAYFCKHPPHQFTDDESFQMVERFIKGTQLVQVKDVLRVNKKLGLGASPSLISESLTQN